MIKAFTVSILSLFFSSVQIAFINENTEGYLEKAGLLKLTRNICIKKGTVPGNTGRMGTLMLVEEKFKIFMQIFYISFSNYNNVFFLHCPYFFVIPFYLQSILVHSVNCVKKNVYNSMWKNAQ
jgi:hypothetical protein